MLGFDGVKLAEEVLVEEVHAAGVFGCIHDLGSNGGFVGLDGVGGVENLHGDLERGRDTILGKRNRELDGFVDLVVSGGTASSVVLVVGVSENTLEVEVNVGVQMVVEIEVAEADATSGLRYRVLGGCCCDGWERIRQRVEKRTGVSATFVDPHGDIVKFDSSGLLELGRRVVGNAFDGHSSVGELVPLGLSGSFGGGYNRQDEGKDGLVKHFFLKINYRKKADPALINAAKKIQFLPYFVILSIKFCTSKISF